MQEDTRLKQKPSRGIFGYFILIGTLLLIAILLNGGLNRTVSKRIEYPDLLSAIEKNEVGRVAIRGTSLVGVFNGKNRQTQTADVEPYKVGALQAGDTHTG